jgi:hypothetical protein
MITVTTANTAPNLLTLPRELRDRIYSYLTHTIAVEWNGFTKDAPRGAEGDEQIVEPLPGRLLSCPYPSVLCIHPRIYEEYNATCAKALEVVFDQSLYMMGPQGSRHIPRMILKDHVLARLRHVTIFVRLHARTTSQNLDWRQQLHVLRSVAAKAPQLETLRVALRQQYLSDAPTCQDSEVPAVLVPAAQRFQDAKTDPFLPDLPSALSHLSLVQRGEGCHVGYASTIKAQQQPLHPDLVATYTLDGQAHVVYHGIRKIGVYTFARENGNYDKRLWTQTEVVTRWPMRKYPEEAIDNVSPERSALLLRFPLEMTEWIEKRGVEEAKNWL